MRKRPKPGAVIFAKDITKMAGFYGAVAEMTVVRSDVDHVVLDDVGFQLVIHSIPQKIAVQIPITEPPLIRDETPVKICLPVTSIGFARNRAAELGGRVGSKDKEWEEHGFRSCDGFDPEGNVFQVRECAA